MGGDALKAYLLVRAGSGVPIEEGFVSVVVAKTTLVASLAAFVGSAFVFAWAFGDVSSSMLVLLALLSLYMAASTAGFAWAQRRGMFRMGGRALAWIGLGERVAVGAERLDAGLSWYYRERRAQAAAVLGLSFVGWATGALETWLMLYLLDSPVSLLTALIIEAGATGVRAVGFLIPGSIGVLEGGLVGIFSMLARLGHRARLQRRPAVPGGGLDPRGLRLSRGHAWTGRSPASAPGPGDRRRRRRTVPRADSHRLTRGRSPPPGALDLPEVVVPVPRHPAVDEERAAEEDGQREGENGHTLARAAPGPSRTSPRLKYQSGPKTNARQFQVGTNFPPWRMKIAKAASSAARSRATPTWRGRRITPAGATPAA